MLDSQAGTLPAADESTSRKPVLVLRKVRQVLDAFSPAAPALTARGVQQRTGLPGTTCLRLLQALVEEGFLDRRGDTYHPGLALLRWGGLVSESLDLVPFAAPALQALRDATGESACLYLRDDACSTVVAVEPTPHTVIHVLRVGQTLPLHAGSAGRVFLAFDSAAPPLDALPLPALTCHTLTDVGRLRDAVARTKRDGFAVTFEERSIGAASVSAPVFDATGALVAVLGIASPVQRFGPDLVPLYVAHVTRTAAGLCRRLGHDPEGQSHDR